MNIRSLGKIFSLFSLADFILLVGISFIFVGTFMFLDIGPAFFVNGLFVLRYYERMETLE